MIGSIDFVLPSCCGYIPESMWLVVSVMLNTMLKRCWFLLGAFVVIKMLVSAFVGLGEDRFSAASQMKIVAQTFLITVFLIYYKTFLMTFDYMIDSLCFIKSEVIKHVRDHTQSVTKSKIWLAWLSSWFNRMLSLPGGSLFFCMQQGVSAFMHYVRSIALLTLSVLGPLSVLFALLPGPFKSSFTTWSRSYIHVTCWAIILTIIDILEETFTFGTDTGISSNLLSAALLVVTFFVPTWTSKLISSVDLGNIVIGMGRASSMAYKAASTLVRGR